MHPLSPMQAYDKADMVWRDCNEPSTAESIPHNGSDSLLTYISFLLTLVVLLTLVDLLLLNVSER